MNQQHASQMGALPARVRLMPAALANLDIAVLPLPFLPALRTFRSEMEQALAHEQRWKPDREIK